jgi:hypothetical protein
MKTIDLIPIIVGIISGVLQIAGYTVYNLKVKSGRIDPNASSWAIWTFGSILNLVSYAQIAQDWVKEILPACCAASCVVTFLLALKWGKFSKPPKSDWMILLLDIVIIAVWYTLSATEANLLYQVSTIFSFIPLIRGLMNGDKEDPIPWGIWTVAYALLTVAVCMRWEKWQDVVYPLNCLILHFIVQYLAEKQPSPQKCG